MVWAILVVSALLEAVWATALGYSEGFGQPGPTIVFASSFLASVLGLAYATKHIPIGTAYAVWVGIGAALTVIWAMVAGDEEISIGKLLFVAGIVAAVVALKRLPSVADKDSESPAAKTSDGGTR